VIGLYGFTAGLLIAQVLKQCGDDLSRENIMRQALNIKGFAGPGGLPGATIDTSPSNYFPIRQLWLSRFNGESWELFGNLLSD
jgi:branched-chain amino acid transport system substrate-binding protein